MLLALTLAWAPMPFASVGPGASALLALAVSGALLLAAPEVDGRRLRTVAGPGAALLGLAAWGALQALSLPAAWAAALAAERVRWWEAANGALAAASEGTEPLRVSLSLTPDRTLTVALWLCVLAAALVTAAVVGADRRRRRWLVAALAAAQLFELVYGARHLMAGATEIWGAEAPTAAARLRGTFINPNHFAGYLEIGLAVVFAWIWVAFRHTRFETSREARVLACLPPIVVWLALFVGLAFTRSRAGLVAGLVAVALQGLLVAIVTRRWKLAPIGLLAAAAGVAVVATFGLRQGFGRLLGSEATAGVAWEARLELYRATVELWSRTPVAGTGLGSFADVFPSVQPREVVGTFLHAHSDPLELLLTAGIVGALIAIFGLWSLLVRLSRVLTRSRRSEDRAAALAALGALVAMAVHESFDFVLTNPANALTLAVLCGAAATAGSGRWRQQRRQRRDASSIASATATRPGRAVPPAQVRKVSRCASLPVSASQSATAAGAS